MKILFVFAHPEPKSFNGALLQTAMDHLNARGHQVRVSDLYAQRFDPSAGPADYTERANPDVYEYRAEMKHALAGSGYVPQIEEEQEKLRWCEVLILQFPMWWFGPPAILKGWIDRVMTYGFAYTPTQRFEDGLLKGRRALVSVTTGARESVFAPDGMDGDIHRILWPLQNGVLRYVGFDVLPPFIAHGIGLIDEPARVAMLDALRNRLDSLLADAPLFFHPLADYGPDRRLKPGVTARTSFQWNPGDDWRPGLE
ncbi:MAG TPA: NAD(P)H-dependent oxidoreductase [Burkholderiales bacterium]|nr:NAD(P)H-dependent oxidoreductase [Burkholderiales bacterium]